MYYCLINILLAIKSLYNMYVSFYDHRQIMLGDKALNPPFMSGKVIE